MPELAELRLTAAYINECSGSGAPTIRYTHIKKNPVHKGKDIELPFEGDFGITAESRGKELILWLSQQEEKVPLKMTMGMSGHFKLTNTGQEPKHAHLKFYRHDGTTLSFVDVRRFGKWKLGETWGTNRGPDPTMEPDEFKYNILKNLDQKVFDQPIHLILMNQKYFNGIGNYLRAEILYRLPNVDPFLPAREVIENCPKILDLCIEIPRKAYSLGGGQLKDWENPWKSDKEKFEKFIKCYNNKNMAYIKDKNGRRFWFDPKWSIGMLEEVLKQQKEK